MALIDGLSAIGDAIREKTGRTDLIPFLDMPEAIRNIGGGETTGRREKTGTFTLETNTLQPIITHDCGFTPTVFMVYPIDTYTIGDKMAIGCIMVNDSHFSELNADRKPSFVWECQNESTNWYGTVSTPGETTDNTIKLCIRSSTYQWRAGFKYGWIAIE